MCRDGETIVYSDLNGMPPSNSSRPGSGIHGEEEAIRARGETVLSTHHRTVAHRNQQRQWQHTKDLTRLKPDGVPALRRERETQDHTPNQESI